MLLDAYIDPASRIEALTTRQMRLEPVARPVMAPKRPAALSVAVRRGFMPIVRIIAATLQKVKEGGGVLRAAVSAANYEVLKLATELGNVEMVRLLMAAVAPMGSKAMLAVIMGMDDWLLHLALHRGDHGMIDLMLEAYGGKGCLTARRALIRVAVHSLPISARAAVGDVLQLVKGTHVPERMASDLFNIQMLKQMMFAQFQPRFFEGYLPDPVLREYFSPKFFIYVDKKRKQSLSAAPAVAAPDKEGAAAAAAAEGDAAVAAS